MNQSSQSVRLRPYPIHLHHDSGGRIKETNPGAEVQPETSRRQDGLQKSVVNPIEGLGLI